MGNKNYQQEEMFDMAQNPYVDTQSGASPRGKHHKGQGTYGSFNNPYMQNQGNANLNNSQATNGTQTNTMGGLDMSALLKGALLGAAATYVLTNEEVQKTIFKTFAKMGDFAGAGLEELKERFEDAKAEVEAEKQQ